MAATLDISHTPIRLTVSGAVSPIDAREVIAAAETVKARSTRPGLLVDGREASAPVVLWTQPRRDRLTALLSAFGPVAVVTTDRAAVNAVKLALDPLGSALVWRIFADTASATEWLDRVEKHGRAIWSDQPGPEPTAPQLDKLYDAVRTRRATM
jgi:hypothetical protein